MPFNTLSGPVGKVKSKETIDYVKPQSNNKDGFKPKSSELKKTKRNTRGLSEGPTDSSHVQFVSSMAQFIKGIQRFWPLGRVYFDCPRTVHTQIPESVHLLNVDNDHVYTPFYAGKFNAYTRLWTFEFGQCLQILSNVQS